MAIFVSGIFTASRRVVLPAGDRRNRAQSPESADPMRRSGAGRPESDVGNPYNSFK
jgi:hypothetical protein